MEEISRDGDTALEQGQVLRPADARLSVYHFARQFKAATGLPPHQYVIALRVERAKRLLQEGSDLSLAEVAADAGFSDQSQFRPPLQAPRRCHPRAVPDTRKDRLTARNPLQETAERPPYHSS